MKSKIKNDGTLHYLQAQETERNFADIAEATLSHLGPLEPPSARTCALETATTFVQKVLGERSKDKQSSKVGKPSFFSSFRFFFFFLFFFLLFLVHVLDEVKTSQSISQPWPFEGR